MGSHIGALCFWLFSLSTVPLRVVNVVFINSSMPFWEELLVAFSTFTWLSKHHHYSSTIVLEHLEHPYHPKGN